MIAFRIEKLRIHWSVFSYFPEVKAHIFQSKSQHPKITRINIHVTFRALIVHTI